MASELVKIKGLNRSFHSAIKVSRKRVTAGALEIGTMIFHKVFQREAPSILAASSIEMGMASKCCLKT
jgi:hypothetical protein